MVRNLDVALCLVAVVAMVPPSAVALLVTRLVPDAVRAIGDTCAAAGRRLSAPVEVPYSPRPVEAAHTLRSGARWTSAPRPATRMPALRWALYELILSGAVGLAPTGLHASLADWLVGAA